MPTVEQLLISFQGDQAVAGANAAAAALERAAKATEAFGKVTEQSDEKLKRSGPSFEQVTNKVDGLAAATARIEAINRTFIARQEAVNTALAKGDTSAAAAAIAIQRLTAIRDKDIASAQEYGRKLEAGFAGVDAATSSTSRSFAGATDGSKKLQFAMRDLTTQSIDVFQGLATGQPILRTLIQQGAQVAQVNQVMGISFREFAGAIVSKLITPTNLAITAIAGLGAAAYVLVSRAGEMEASQRTLAISLTAVGKSAEISAGQVKGYTDAIQAQGYSKTESTGASNILARNPALNSEQIQRATKDVGDLATALNVDLNQAAENLAGILAGNADSIHKVDDALNFLTPSQRAAADAAASHNDALGAAKIAMDALENRIGGLRKESLTPMQQDMINLKTGWDAFLDSLANSGVVRANIKAFGEDFKWLSERIRDAQNYFSGFKGMVTTATGQTPANVHGTPVGATAAAAAAQKNMTAIVSTEPAAPQELYGPGLTTDAQGQTATQNMLALKRAQTSAQETIDGSKAGQIDKLRVANDNYRKSIEMLNPAILEDRTQIALLSGAMDVNDAKIEDLSKVTEKHTKTVKDHVANIDKQEAKLRTQIAAQDGLRKAYGEGGDAVREYIAKEAASKQLIDDGILPSNAAYNEKLKERTALFLKLDANQAMTNVAKGNADLQDQIAYVKAETESLGMNVDARERMLAAIKAEQQLKRDGVPLDSDVAKARIAETDALVAGKQKLQEYQTAMTEVGNIATQAFTTVGTAITNAFVSGSSKAVSFGSVMKGVFTQIVQSVAQLAVLNPILNSITGGNRTTLDSVFGALSQGRAGTSTGTSGATSVSSQLGVNNLSSVASAANTASGGSLYESLGITGKDGIFSKAGNYLGISGDGVSGFMNQGIFGTSAIEVANAGSSLATTQALAGLGQGVYGPATLAQVAGTEAAAGSSTGLLGGASVGGLLSAAGYVAAGYGAGSFAGSLVQSGLNKTGPGPQVGAAAGSLAGLAVGLALAPETLGLSVLIGGLIGGAGGGLIGPHPKSPYSTEQVTVQNGRLGIGRTDSQLIDNTAEIQGLQSDIATLNAFLDKTGLTLTNQGAKGDINKGGFTSEGTIFQIGQNTPGSYQDPTKVDDLNTGFNRLTFGPSNTDDPVFNRYVAAKSSFTDYDELTKYIQTFTDAKATLKSFFTDVLAPMTAMPDVTGTLATTVENLRVQFNTAIASAEGLKTSIAASDDDVKKLAQAEIDLTVQREKGIAAANAAVSAQIHQSDVSITSRLLKANATISGSPTDALNAALYDFDQGAGAQRVQLSESLKGIFGAGFTESEYYAQEMALLEKTLVAERAAIVKQGYDQIIAATQNGTDAVTGVVDQAAQDAKNAAELLAQQTGQAQQNAAGLVTSITEYVRKLQLGADSTLSPQAQYDLASSQFNAVSGAARAGDFKSQAQLTGYADALLSASRTVNGSGLGYATDTNRVLDALQGIADRSADQLTADALRVIQQSQTDQVVASLDDLKTVLTQMLAQLRSNGSQPASLAA